jgi:hypothetical protein
MLHPNNPQFIASVEQALKYRAEDTVRCAMYCRGLKTLYRHQKMIFVMEDSGRHVSFRLLEPVTKIAVARHLHIDSDAPPIRIYLPPKDFNQPPRR